MRRALLPALLILAVAATGCFGSKKNPVKTPITPPPYSRATPQDVLESLIRAYETRDSTEYRKLYALDYLGGSYDTSSAGAIDPGTFTWADEVRHIQKLRQDNNILGVNLDLGSRGTWVRTSATGGEGWAEITIFNPHLQIDTSIDSYVLTSNEVFTFTFAPDTAAASPTDTLWTIVRWFEDGPGAP